MDFYIWQYSNSDYKLGHWSVENRYGFRLSRQKSIILLFETNIGVNTSFGEIIRK